MTQQRPLQPQSSELLAAAVDAICDQFEAAWLAQENPQIEDYLATAGEAAGGRLVKELLLAEFELRKQNGEQLDGADYLRRFPAQAELIRGALGQSDAAGESMGHAATALHGRAGGSGCVSVRCPQCNTPLELGDDASLVEITCSSCGNCFGLVDDVADDKSLQAGATVGHFLLLEKVGVGGFGSVWKAQDQELDRIVSIKIPRRGQLDAIEIEQFLRELRAAAQLNHPNIVGIHEVGRDGETVYIVSDFVEGVPLSDYLADRRFSMCEAAVLCATIGEALDHAHENGVIHRDMKPANIMLDSQGKPHLTDFGLARREAGEVTMTYEGHVLGTPAYMSPELAQGEAHHADRRSDVYSLGVILFQLLTGEPPFRGNIRMLIQQVAHDEPPSPRRLNSNIPRDLETICLKCMEKEPRRRYLTAQEVAGELDRYLNGKPILARPVSRAARVGKWCRRNPATALLTGALAIALLSGMTGITWQWTKTKAEAERNRELLYVSDVAKVAESWEAGNVGLALDLLKRHVPRPGERDLRGFEWRHLWKRCQPSLLAATFEPVQSFSVFAMAVSRNGRFLATVGGPGRVVVWDLRTGTHHELKGHQNVVAGVAFSPDNRVLASSGHDGRTYLWNVDTGKRLGFLDGGASGVEFSRDGKLLAVCEGNGVAVWDVSNLDDPVKRHFLSIPGPRSAAFSPDGLVLASGGVDALIRLWSVVSGETSDPPLKGHSARVYAVSFSPDGATLLSSSVDKTVRLWDVATRTQLEEFVGHSGVVRSAVFSPDGMTIASGSYDGTARLWDVASGGLKDTIRGHEFMLYSVAYSPDGRTLFTGSGDGTIKRWNLATRKPSAPFEGNAGGGGSPIAFAPRSKLLAAARRVSEVTLWDLTNGNEVATFTGHSKRITDLQLSRDGTMAASATWSEGVKLWKLESLEVVHELEGSRTVAFSPKRGVLATGGPGGETTIQLWDVASGRLQLTLPGIGEKNLNSLAFSPDGKTLASGGEALTKRNFVLWDSRTGEEIAAPEGHVGAVDSIAFSPDGSVVCTGGYDGMIKLWDARTWTELATRIDGRHTSRVSSVAFSPDGRTLVSGSEDGTIRLWHVATGGHLLTIDDHQANVGAVAFSADGALMVSSGGDGAIRLWPAATEEELEAAGW